MRTDERVPRRPKRGGAAHRGVGEELVKAAVLSGSGEQSPAGEVVRVGERRGEVERRSWRGEWARRGGAGGLDGGLRVEGNGRRNSPLRAVMVEVMAPDRWGHGPHCQ